MNMILTCEEKRGKAAVIVHVFAMAHAGVAFTLANALIGDTVVLTGLTIWMIQKIGGIYGCNSINPWKVLGKVFGFVAGTYIGAKLLFFLPVIGNFANAAATSLVTETIGWTCIYLMESFDDPSKATKEDWDRAIRQAKNTADENKEENEQLLKKMTKGEKNKYKEINEAIRNGNLTDKRERELLKEMVNIRQQILSRLKQLEETENEEPLPYDISTMTVHEIHEILNELDDAKIVDRMKKQESNDKNRTTAIEAFSKKLNQLEKIEGL